MTAYGWWLPNGPRGSTSNAIASDLIAQLGELHYGRKRVQPSSREIRAFYSKAQHVLQHDLLDFVGDARNVVAEGFERCIAEHRYTCYAAVIMLDHVHLCIRKHRDRAEDMIEHLQSHTAQMLIERDLRPPNHPVWATGGWIVYLDGVDDFHRTIRYIDHNPLPFHERRQNWTWITPYDGWPHRAND